MILHLPFAGGACARQEVNWSQGTVRHLTLYGGTVTEVEILLGAPGWAESSRRTFAGARWDFFPNGTFRFAPSATAEVRDDLYPFTGAYRVEGDRLELHATRRAELGASISLVGFVREAPGEPKIEAVESTVSGNGIKIVRIAQALREDPEQVGAAAWPPVPADFAITLQGKVAGEPFGPLPGRLSLRPSRVGDTNPLSLSLETRDQDQHGSLAWTSFLATAEPKARFNTVAIDTAKQEIVAHMLPGVKHPLAPTWIRLGRSSEMPGLDAIPDWIQAREGTVRLLLNGSRLGGEISASGQGLSPGKVLYNARIEGTLQEMDVVTQPVGYENPYTGEILFEGAWRSEQLGLFELQQAGTSVRGMIGERGTEFSGLATGNVLSFRWNENEAGFLVALSDRRHLIGLLPTGPDRWRGGVAVRTEEIRPVRQDPAASRQELKYRGYDLLMEGRCLEAIEVLEQARALFRQDRDRAEISELMRDSSMIDEINILTRLSACYTRLHRFENLLGSLREHVHIIRLLSFRGYLREPTVTGAPSTQENLVGALEAYRRQLTSDLDKIQAQEASRTFFEELVELLLELGQETEALVASEKARARAFTDLLAVGEPMRSLPDGQVIGTDSALPVTAAGIKETAHRLRSTIVEYMVTEQRLFIWVLSPQGEVRVETVSVTKEAIEELVQELSHLVRFNPQVRGASRIDDSSSPAVREQQILRRLHDVLIGPIVKHLPPEQRPARVTFIPHRWLFLVPFPALLDAENRPLLVRYTLSTAPSIGALDSLHPPAPGPWSAPEVLVVGNPALPHAYAYLGSLGGAAREAESVARRFAARRLIGRAATKEALVKAMPRARLIHLASHGLLEHGSEKNFPGALVFASEIGNDLLTAREIADLDLRADLVVLSACDTGGGRITGDGVVGLARSFLVAGAKGVVVSLWKVNDEATVFLMDEFYRHLVLRGDRAYALRQAMLATRERYRDPRVWAAFTFIGTEPMDVERK